MISSFHFGDVLTRETVHGDVFGWGTVLQAGRSRVRFPMVPF